MRIIATTATMATRATTPTLESTAAAVLDLLDWLFWEPDETASCDGPCSKRLSLGSAASRRTGLRNADVVMRVTGAADAVVDGDAGVVVMRPLVDAVDVRAAVVSCVVTMRGRVGAVAVRAEDDDVDVVAGVVLVTGARVVVSGAPVADGL